MQRRWTSFLLLGLIGLPIGWLIYSSLRTQEPVGAEGPAKEDTFKPLGQRNGVSHPEAQFDQATTTLDKSTAASSEEKSSKEGRMGLDYEERAKLKRQGPAPESIDQIRQQIEEALRSNFPETNLQELIDRQQMGGELDAMAEDEIVRIRERIEEALAAAVDSTDRP